MKRSFDVASSSGTLPVSGKQRSAIFCPADLGRRDAPCRTAYCQGPDRVGQERALSNADVDGLLKSQRMGQRLSDDCCSFHVCFQ